MYRKGIFISYSHEDRIWADRIISFLKPLARDEQVIVWDDSKIEPGADWSKEIENAIKTTRIAILLVTPDFLSSDFIFKKELPLIFDEYKKGGLIVYWVSVNYSVYEYTILNQIQAANDPSRPLDSLTEAEQNKVLVEITKKIANAININVVGNTLNIIDKFFPQQKAFIENKKEEDIPVQFSVQAHQQQDTIQLTNQTQNTVETITAADLDKLDEQSKQLLRSFETSMTELYDRWTEQQPKSIARDEYVRNKARAEMKNIRKDLCDLLNKTLDFLDFIGKNLQDHYNGIRYICSLKETD